MWYVETGVAVGEPITGHIGGVSSVAHSPSGRHIVSGSLDKTNYVWRSSLHTSIQPPTSPNPTYPNLCVTPDPDGWVRESEHSLLYWVPPDCRTGLHSSLHLTIPLTSPVRSVSLDFQEFA